MKERVRRVGAVLAVWGRRWWWIVALLTVLLVVAYLARDIPNYPANRAAETRTSPAVATALATVEPKERLAFEKDLLQYETDNQIKIWTGIIGLFTGIAAVTAGVIAWRNLRATQAKLEVDREAQITNRFTQAITQLGAELKDGKPNLEVRLGGIYALERIARDSPRDHWTIMEILTAYVRENARWVEPTPAPGGGAVSSAEDAVPEQSPNIEGPPPLHTDIQAILRVLGRRMRSEDRAEPDKLDLHGTDLRRADLYDAHLEDARFYDAHLEGADFRDAHLEGAEFVGAHLQDARFSDAHLEGARLVDAHLQDARLLGAHLQDARLLGAHLQGAHLGSAHLKGAWFVGADLAEINQLTQAQVYSARDHGEGAILPPDWPADWRDRFEMSSEQPPVTPSPPPV
jgi:Pentapeptide repeats (8 copies)